MSLLAGVAWLLALALDGAAATPPSPVVPRAFQAELGLVHVTAVVEDGRGHLVTDLKAEDFELREDGRVQKLAIFARAQEPGRDELLSLDLGLLFDTSESMLSELKLSQEAAVRFLDSIPRARDLLTVFFDQDIRISRYDSENQQGLFERIHAAKGGGRTALYDSIAVYLSRVQDAPGRKVLVLFTDGEDSTSTLGLGDVLAALRSSSVTVYAIGFTSRMGSGSNRWFLATSVLRRMTELTGGKTFMPSASRDLPAIYQQILDDLGNQYLLGYEPSNARRDGAYRRLELTVKRRGLKVRARDGYTAPAD